MVQGADILTDASRVDSLALIKRAFLIVGFIYIFIKHRPVYSSSVGVTLRPFPGFPSYYRYVIAMDSYSKDTEL